MPRKARAWQLRFTDMAEACEPILNYAAGHSSETLIHGYFDIRPDVLLSTAIKNVQPLHLELKAIIGQLPSDV